MKVVPLIQTENLIQQNKLVIVLMDIMKSEKQFVNLAVKLVKHALDHSRLVPLAIQLIRIDWIPLIILVLVLARAKKILLIREKNRVYLVMLIV